MHAPFRSRADEPKHQVTASPVAQEVAKHLIDIDAVTISVENPFVWTSGRKAPIYCDNRLILGYPDIRKKIAECLVMLVQNLNSDIDVVAGTATAGIAHAAWMADIMSLPMVYVRNSPKAHGKEKKIEGVINKGQKVVIVEDHISTGGSVINAVETIQSAGAIPVAVVAIFTYGFLKSIRMPNDEILPIATLSSLNTLIDMMGNDNHGLSSNDIESLRDWHRDPIEWSALRGGK